LKDGPEMSQSIQFLSTCTLSLGSATGGNPSQRISGCTGTFWGTRIYVFW